MGAWLYLEPYVHVVVKGQDVLFYNTLDGEALEYRGRPAIARLAERLSHEDNLYVIELAAADRDDPAWSDCIAALRERFMGDVYDDAEGARRPAPLKPLYRIMRDVSILGDEVGRSVGEDVMEYLQQVRIFLSESCAEGCAFCDRAYRQIPHCHAAGPGGDGEQAPALSLAAVRGFLDQIHLRRPLRLQLTGGDLFRYPHLGELLAALSPLRFAPECLVSFRNAAGRLDEMERLGGDVSWWIGVDFPVAAEAVGAFHAAAQARGISVSWSWIIQCDADFEAAQALVASLEPASYRFHPLFNGENREFLEETVFLTRDEVLSARTPPRELFARRRLNALAFGQLTIRADGQVYADVNQPPLGRIGEQTPQELLLRELTGGRSWLGTRDRVSPCQDCLYDALCPPLSGYEHALGRNDLCDFGGIGGGGGGDRPDGSG